MQVLPHDSERSSALPSCKTPGSTDRENPPEPTVKQTVHPYQVYPPPGHEPGARAPTVAQSNAEQIQAQHWSNPELDLAAAPDGAGPNQAFSLGPWPVGLERLRPLALLPDGEIWLAREGSPPFSLLAVKISRPEDFAPQAQVLRVADHEPVDYLGAGTYGEVLLYREHQTGRRVAVKFFARGNGGSLEWQLLQAEVKQLSLLDADPGIVQIKDVEATAQPPYYVMTYAEHGSIARRLTEQGPMPVHQALAIFRRTAEALAYVHAKGVRHCDLKPGNVLLDAVDRPLLADFGQAHLASDLSPALGTFFYMAPEQATLEPGPADARWDVYSLGALMYALVTGKPPHEDRELLQTLQHTSSLPDRLRKYRDWVARRPRPEGHRQVKGMDRRLADIISQCLEVNPAQRPSDAGAVVAALARRRRDLRRQPLLLFGLIAPVVVMLVMTAFGALVGSSVLGRAQTALADQLQSNEEVMARLVANVLQNRIDYRVAEVERRSADPALIADLRNGAGQAKLNEELQRFKRYDRQQYFFKWTLADPQGHIIADEIHEPELHGKLWAWRDWFNGTGHKFKQKDQWFPPIQHTHVSQPYVAQGIDDQAKDNPLCLSISTPVRDPEAGHRLLGLLVGTMHFADLEQLFQHIGLDVMHGDVVILDNRKNCLMHEDMEEVERRIRVEHNPEPVPDSPVVEALIDRHQGGSTANFTDPLTGQDCLAGYAPVKHYGWGVIVQHERKAALQPVAHLRHWMAGWGISLFVIMSLVTTGLWGALMWTLRQEERPHVIP